MLSFGLLSFSIKIWEMETFIGGSFGLLWVHFKQISMEITSGVFFNRFIHLISLDSLYLCIQSFVGFNWRDAIRFSENWIFLRIER